MDKNHAGTPIRNYRAQHWDWSLERRLEEAKQYSLAALRTAPEISLIPRPDRRKTPRRTTGIALLAGTGLRINLSGSLPLDFYRLTAASIERGALVAACPDLTHPVLQQAHERGYLAPGWGCDGGIAPLLKRVLALPGD